MPAWAGAKSGWGHESLGWFRGGELVGAGLVLTRRLGKIPRYLAYLPEGPILDWQAPDLEVSLDSLATYLESRGAFAVRIGPLVKVRAWNADTIKRAIATDAAALGDVLPDDEYADGIMLGKQLAALGWRRQSSEGGFSDGQPAYVFQLPIDRRTTDDLLAGMNQLWRRNIKKAEKSGVRITTGSQRDLPAFHQLYAETARRDGFTPRPLAYFQQMFASLLAEDPDRIRLYLAHHDADLVAATTWVRVGRHVWYSYGASSATKREVRGSNAIQWAMITDAVRCGADVYDLRGITDTLDPADPHVGLIQFKAGTGGRAVEYLGEWDLPLNRPLYKAFELYLSRR